MEKHKKANILLKKGPRDRQFQHSSKAIWQQKDKEAQMGMNITRWLDNRLFFLSGRRKTEMSSTGVTNSLFLHGRRSCFPCGFD